MLNIMKNLVCCLLKKNSPSRYFIVFIKVAFGDGLIAVVVSVTTAAELKEMTPQTSSKPLSLR
jgi:hypothetical protein